MFNPIIFGRARLCTSSLCIAATLGLFGANAIAAPTRLVYTSAFSQYRPHDDPAVQSWRQANETVTRIGGWRVYLKESQTPDAAPPTPVSSAQKDSSDPATNPAKIAPALAPAPKPAVDPHAGHRR